MLQNELTTLLKMQGTRVRISWTVSSGIPTWNDTCAWAIEKFGLPGDNFNTHIVQKIIWISYSKMRKTQYILR